ncbi:uncharacterized protein F4812DRAFT_307099 [Daldinia caldariorum]|uniref:uncharacterized protein n=1 Tax=Daldinia caldariorum TaxID=326644 RepID=UPI0020073692|nr:uncharacterized protein F4812DRAFT_307099 [Daldinia caldariorum]KAI1469927.1 hypothetical protein F4812DRAFT_307099 [Daldinia caldariorum]
MNLPYQYLSRLGQSSILCAAKGASIHTFDLDAGNSFLSSWTRPLAKKPSSNGESQETAGRGEGQEGQAGQGLDDDEQESGQQRPSKKRKLNADNKPGAEERTSQADAGTVEAAANGNGNGSENGNGNGKKKQKPESRVQGPEIPFVSLMEATEDGRYLVAVTGQDKTLWVLEHDGKGVLKDISQRVMPKRPSSIAITPDGNTILSADKFGDVYALPLIPSATSPEATSTTSASPSSATTAAAAPSFKLAANRLTVHSQRNLRALEEQERILASRQAAAQSASASTKEEEPKYEPVLGHVSMLTALALATGTGGNGNGKPYVITADRDEHIRVSRGAPAQYHVVETYCLGHEAFLGALCVPASRPEVLVSAGGDDELFVWEWEAGRLVGKADILRRAKEVVGVSSADQVAVSQLLSYDADGKCYVLAVCERVPAVFIFQLLPDTSLQHVQTLRLQGNPLNALVVTRPEGSPRLIVATDPHQPDAATTAPTTTTGDAPTQAEEEDTTTSSLLLYERDKAGNWVQKGNIQDVADGNLHVSRKELESILYTVENLRKNEFADEAEGGSAVP